MRRLWRFLSGRRTTCLLVAAVALLALANSGCSVVKATQQPEKKNLQVLAPGVPRTHVIAQLGAPVWTEERNGMVTDVFAFKQGYSKWTKAGRAAFHGVADFFTLGAWEIVGTPAETVASGSNVRVAVTYDQHRFVQSVQVIEGEKMFGPGASPSPGGPATSVATDQPPLRR